MSVTYPLDVYGTNPLNIVENELHSVSESHFRDYFFLVPNCAPFYVDDFTLTYTVNNITKTLIEDVDYTFVLPYTAATRVTGKNVYGAVSLHNLDLNGLVTIKKYRTIGGDQIVDRNLVLVKLADSLYNTATVLWDSILEIPDTFPPTPHYEDYDNFYGQEEVVKGLMAIRDAILNNGLDLVEELRAYFQQQAFGGNISNGYLPLTGGVLSGNLTLNGDPITNKQAATKQYVDSQILNFITNFIVTSGVQDQLNKKVNKSGDTVTGPIVSNVVPTVGSHLVNKKYVDDAIATATAGNLDFATKAYVDSLVKNLSDSIEHMLLLYSTHNTLYNKIL